MFNLHLLKNDLTPTQVADIDKHWASYKHGAEYVRRLPMYTVAICPICQKENIEHLDTYSSRYWVLGRSPGKVINCLGPESIAYHCEHFALGQSFLGYFDPSFQKIILKPMQPYVYGVLLEQNKAQAVIHALPICDFVENQYVPLHTLYMFTYFSENGRSTYQDIKTLAINRIRATEATTWLITPHAGQNEDHWYDLSYWVERGLLHWVDASHAKEAGDGKSLLKTNDPEAFLYASFDRASR